MQMTNPKIALKPEAEPARAAAGEPVVIIGGGVAGLACGCYLQMNGYRTTILESHSVPGGLCAAWERGPYLFDGCLRWLVGTDPSSSFHQIWHELGVLPGARVIDHPEFLRVEGENGTTLSLSADLNQLARDCRRISPADAARVDTLVAAARRCAPLDPPLEKPLELMSGLEKMKLLGGVLPMLPVILRWKRWTLTAYLERYQSPFLREALMAVAGEGRMSALVLVMILGWRSRRNAGYVVGGSRAIVQALSQRYLRLGGKLRCGVEAAAVQVEDHRATGVRCADGTTVPASTVISCADGQATLFRLLEGRYLNRALRHAYEHFAVFPGLVQASFGINQSLPEVPHALSLPLSSPLRVDDITCHDRLEVSLVGPESGLCPPGKTIMTIRLFSRYEYWANLRDRQPEAYEQAKTALLAQFIQILERRFPGTAARVEFTDLATPATFARFTGNWQGSFQGWLPTPQILGQRLPRTLPGLKNFYMAGQWVEPGGGLPSAALSARYVAQLLCGRDGQVFAATSA